MTAPSRTAVLGLGPMGAPIARNLLSAGYEVQVWNRTPAVARALVDEGAQLAAAPSEIDAPVILSVLPDIQPLRSLLTADVRAAWGRLRPLLVILSTTSPAQVRDLARELRPHGIRVADAPMSGGDRGAREATLSFMVGAHEHDVADLESRLRAIGRTIIRFGDPGAGSVAKLANQIVVAGTLTSIAEALAFAEAADIRPADLMPVLENGLASSTVLSLKREKLLTGDYSLGGSAVNQLKDLDYAADIAANVGAHVPLTALMQGMFRAVDDAGRGSEDHSVVLEYFRARTGGSLG